MHGMWVARISFVGNLIQKPYMFFVYTNPRANWVEKKRVQQVQLGMKPDEGNNQKQGQPDYTI